MDTKFKNRIILFIHTLSNRTHTLDCTARLRRMIHVHRVKQTEVMWNSIFMAIWIQPIFLIPISFLALSKGMKYYSLTEKLFRWRRSFCCCRFPPAIRKIDKAMAENVFFIYFGVGRGYNCGNNLLVELIMGVIEATMFWKTYYVERLECCQNCRLYLMLLLCV